MADTTLYKQIVLEWGQDTDSLIWGMGYSPDNGEHFYVLNTTYGRKYRIEDGDRIWPFLVDKVKAVLDWSAITNKPDVALKSDLTWSNITNKPDLALKTDLTWSNVTGKPDVALKSDVAAVSAVASSANAKADSNAKLIAGKASQEDLNSVSSTASSALDKATSNSNALASKVNKSDLVWTNITNRPDFDSVASQASQAVVTANVAESQASAAGQAAASASAQASAAKTTADTAVATANAAKASASTASATAASAQQVANSASASASATAVALKNKADTDTVNAQFTAVNSNVASAQSTADSAVSVADGAVATANSAKSMATSAAGVANTANATANSALTKANSASTVANQANTTASNANNNASNAVSVANSAKSTADSANSNANSAVNTANTANTTANNVKDKVNDITSNGGGRNLLRNSNVELHGKAYAFGSAPLTIDHLEAGETYTMSWYGKVDANATKHKQPLQVYIYNAGWGWLTEGIIPYTANEYQRNVFTFTVPKNVTDVDRVEFYLKHYNNDSSQSGHDKDDDAGIGYVKNYMLEKGTIAHDWQLAPEDIQSEIDANSALISNAKTAAANAQSSANSAQSSANSAQNTANTAIKASETLKDLGDYTATASGTASNSTYSGLPRTSGVSMSRVYNNGYPTPYGNVLNVAGIGAGQLLLGWSGTSSANEHLYYRSHRDNGSGGWSTWDKIAYVSDLTWSNISGKPDVATKADVSSALTVANTAKSTADSALSKANSNATALNSKANKSDLTWANISGKPSIPNADDTTTVSSGDLNNYTTTGKYYMPNALSNYTNHPTTGTDMGDWFVMKVDAYHSGDMIVQTIYQINSGDVWIRQRWSGAWKSWRQINFWG